MSDIDIAAVDSLKVLDLNRPIREADIRRQFANGGFGCAGRWRALGPVESEAIRRLVERRHYGEPGARQSADIS